MKLKTETELKEVLGFFVGFYETLHASKIKHNELRPMQSSPAEAKFAQCGKLLELSLMRKTFGTQFEELS